MVSLMLALSLLSTPSAPPKTKWTHRTTRDGVSVSTANKEGSPFLTFKATIEIDAPSAAVLRVLREIENYTEWFAFTETAHVLRTTTRAKIIYMETQFPWPFSNEDMVFSVTEKVTPASDGSVTTLYLEGIPNARPSLAGIYRMKRANGWIQVRPHQTSTTVTYVMHSELGGSVPLWMANQNIHELPIRTLAGLRRTVKLHQTSPP